MPCLPPGCDGAGCCITCVRGGGGHLPKNRKVWDCLTPKRGAEYDKHIGAPPPPPQGKIRSNYLYLLTPPPTPIESRCNRHKHKEINDTGCITKVMNALVHTQSCWGNRFSDCVCVCVSHWWYSVVDCLQISACIINQHYTLEAILVTLGVFLHSYCTHPIYSFLID